MMITVLKMHVHMENTLVGTWKINDSLKDISNDKH